MSPAGPNLPRKNQSVRRKTVTSDTESPSEPPRVAGMGTHYTPEVVAGIARRLGLDSFALNAGDGPATFRVATESREDDFLRTLDANYLGPWGLAIERLCRVHGDGDRADPITISFFRSLVRYRIARYAVLPEADLPRAARPGSWPELLTAALGASAALVIEVLGDQALVEAKHFARKMGYSPLPAGQTAASTASPR